MAKAKNKQSKTKEKVDKKVDQKEIINEDNNIKNVNILSEYNPLQLSLNLDLSTNELVEISLIDNGVENAESEEDLLISNNSLYLYDMYKILQKADEMGAFDTARKVKREVNKLTQIHVI